MNNSNIRPIGCYIHIQPQETESVTSGGIIRASRKVPTTGTVIALSDDYTFEVAVGDKVEYNNSGKKEMEDGTIFIKEDNILYIYND